MKISIAKSVTLFCHPAVNTIGCFGDCFEPATGKITGDYLLIPGGKYTDNTASPPKMYNNDYYCGEGLANIDNSVRVQMPGPVIVRSGHFIS